MESNTVTGTLGAAEGFAAGLIAKLPRGNTLPREAWLRRHRFLLGLLWIQSAILIGVGLAHGFSVLHSLVEGGIPASMAAAAVVTENRRRLASALVAVGLISTSGVLVHITGGLIEAHFHFFVMVLLLALYEDWIPFGIAIGWVLLHHGVLGEIAPGSVYNHPDAAAEPWKWAAIHAAFIFAAAAAAIASWRLNENHRSETHRAILERQAAERDAQRTKDEFMGLISHELRTPLTSIIGYVELIQESPAEDLATSGKGFADVIERNARRELRLVEDLLDITRLDAGKFSVEIGEADLATLVRQAVESARLRAQDKDIKLTCKADDIPVTAGDSLRLGQICDNLISNAIKFTPEGGSVTVSLRRKGEAAVLAVRDTGFGIPADQLERVFERMFRTKQAEHIAGTGLGLTITKGIVDAHDGSIDVESVEGEGTTFRVCLPLVPTEEAAAAARRASAGPPFTAPAPA